MQSPGELRPILARSAFFLFCSIYVLRFALVTRKLATSKGTASYGFRSFHTCFGGLCIISALLLLHVWVSTSSYMYPEVHEPCKWARSLSITTNPLRRRKPYISVLATPHADKCQQHPFPLSSLAPTPLTFYITSSPQ